MSDSADDDMPMMGLGLDEPAQPKTEAVGGAYRVLARKYRPQTFAELIGQDAMVTTLANAIARDRLAHAFLMTGVRGVGKTSTARLIAKALNCIGPDGQGGPTINPCGACEPCRAIAEGRHIDVIEMDAASNTGVDDVREIIEAVRYAAVSARYKIYIVDEVHMLSKNAFNALLKTLEEPPPHVKFLFATTEVQKVPVTVLSRCQRFDLRRITPAMLFDHFAAILTREGVEAEPPAIWLIANAAEGSVRDGLSILDQAIAHADLESGGRVTAQQVRAMLGLSDRSGILNLLGAVLAGDAGAAIDQARQHYALGIEPIALVRGMMDLVHAVTLAKVARHEDSGLPDEDRARMGDWADRLTHSQLHRLWQLLTRGHDEVLRANTPLDHLEMLLLRIVHAAAMPDPGELARMLTNGVPAPASAIAASSHTVAEGTSDAAAIHALLESAQRHRLAVQFHDHGRVIGLGDNVLTLARAPGIDDGAARELADALHAATSQRWRVELSDGEGTPSLGDSKAAVMRDSENAIRELPVVKAALAAFPAARILPPETESRKAS
ncbi:MAG: DNA polymerase III subunit gamma/tau [Sphingopyxis sp.]|nr:DNA polymerase III subunit gamma/tau [Sphingopyxis sp.]